MYRDSARVLLEKAYTLDPTMFGNAAYAMFGYAVTGRWSDVNRVRTELAKDGGGNSPRFFETLNAIVDDDTARAVSAMEKGLDNHEPLFLFVSPSCDPMFGLLKSNLQYQQLMVRYGMHPCPARGAWPIKRRPR